MNILIILLRDYLCWVTFNTETAMRVTDDQQTINLLLCLAVKGFINHLTLLGFTLAFLYTRDHYNWILISRIITNFNDAVYANT